MTSEAARTTWRAALLGLALAAALGTMARPVHAQTAEELKAARELFQEAYKDEQEQRYEVALEKFQRVAKVRESAPVRYRIASVLEQLGRLRDARDAYRAIAASKPNLPAEQKEVADAAADKVLSVDRRIPKLVLQIEEPVPEGARVSVDGVPVPASASPRSIELDPGEHVVQASAGGKRPFDKRLNLVEGAKEPLTVALADELAAASGGTEPPHEEPKPPNRTFGYVALAAGGVLLASAAVVLVMREGKIDDIESACPNNVCPLSRQVELQGQRDDAELFGPLGVGLGVVGLAAAVLGTYIIVRPAPASATARLAPAVRPTLAPAVLPGGGYLGVHARF